VDIAIMPKIKPLSELTARPATTPRAIPLERTTLTAAAFEQLISNVVNGSWKAGDLIPPERELCLQLGIARTSLREALKAMELIGMLESRVGFGTMICPRSEFLSRPLLWAFTGTDHTELSEIMEARGLLERDLAGLAAERASDEEIAAINQTLQLMAKKIEDNEPVLDVDLAFHSAIAQAAHNAVLGNAAQLLRNQMKYWLDLKLRLPHVPESALKLHQSIYEAILNRDPESARRLMWNHLYETSELVTKVVAGHTAGEAPPVNTPKNTRDSDTRLSAKNHRPSAK
jgi:GntR family transcriptional repressor for pyruvate dehydrogenase complex